MASSPVATARRMARAVKTRVEPSDNGGADRGVQQLLALEWRRLAEAGTILPLRDVEFRNTSQNGEDGILLYLYTLAGHGSRRAVEMCAGDAIENNSSNLVLHHDWDVLMVDGDDDLLDRGRAFYAKHPETHRIGPTIAKEWITAANVNEILQKHGYVDDVELLTIDMDGQDYWVLGAMDVRPRVVVVEYNNRIPADVSVTVPPEAEFVAEGGAFEGDGFFGASLAAFNELLTGRDYRLIGANRFDTNAFFLRSDVLTDAFPGVSVASCLQSRWARHQQADWPTLERRPWTSV